ncbi:DNA-directed RNA polymerase V subunit 1 [Physcomitrium patens]|uniref:DNA-directed RNA polymerase subunit n=1 Tax=Physcomitrium patens TaxID=3218 RepID=A0A0C4K0P8_PHYPA|nr:DNA-directed RNA polymerase V subunit 1-like isoform X1 [Physcomitrium patens]XP_024396747.1 DNA-directed RNA polymerase V subunit 1-like isoform X1 [Physcomitrium patens]AHJ37542.1 DNA-dependent RNA polymerase V largest subunit [Physcomitrium patens]PNR39073.1 hypothetical protein PHYPA_019351 [Physcomitrium patens]|eukprot:XP_024396746.1 DNA-directed RNA polymerase V subunit 1-like isoform X1 [Physcomitrella patens]
MQVMEAAAWRQPSQAPTADLVGLQIGLATTSEILGHSVIESRSKDTLISLVDPRLGLPAEDERCATCGGTNYDECTGHFAHVKLTQPIFHPNYIRCVQRVLQKICLACGVPKVKKMKSFSEEAANLKQNFRDIDSEDVGGNGEHPVLLEADAIEKDADDVVILLSSDEEEYPRDILRVVPSGPMDFLIRSTNESAIADLPQLKSYKSKSKAHANGFSHVDVTRKSTRKSSSKKSSSTQNPVKIYKGTPAGLDVLNADTLRTAEPLDTNTCPYCSPGYPDYRHILVKILPVKGRKKNDVSQIILLEVQGSDKGEKFLLPHDFWSFIKGAAYPENEEVPKSHVLSPLEALSILKKISDTAIGKLGMNGLVARPEGLIMKCVPIPPNCTRTTDYKYVSNTTAVRFGTDRVTRTLQNLVNEIGRIQRTRTGKIMKRGQRDEVKVLQVLTAEYLREKGAPKAVPGKEPLKKDRNGRFTKQDDHRWTKDWISQNYLGKGGNYTARAVVAGDPSLAIETIGVPLEIAQKLTVPERATKWNRSKLQEYVDRTQMLQQGSGKPGATRIVRNEEAFQVWANSTHTVQIGDVIHRNIQDGDFVYVNRPPSVHKHSLMALKVQVHYGLVLTINPLVCPPFNADFDGDIFHVFIPQSLQAIAELEHLMAVPQQIISDHGGQPLLGLTQDTLLAAYLLTSSKLLVDKAGMDQLCLWALKQPPDAAIVKSPKGGPFWTGEQIFGLTLPTDLQVGAPHEEVFIEGGEVIRWSNGAKSLRKDSEGIAAALCVQLGPVALVNYLNTATGLLHAWLQMHGFSTGLADFQVTSNSADRQKMLKSIFEDYYQKSIQESCDSVRILDAKVQAMGQEVISSPDHLTRNINFLEQAAQQTFRNRESEVESIVMKYAARDNGLLMMVRSGSKGSRGKLLQQIAGMGLQLYKGQHLLPFSGSRRSSMSNSSELDWWEDKGLVRSSLVDGLNPSELFNHVIADRTVILRKHVEVVQPGTLFKSLMLFLRDLHVMYDGSVRNQCGKNIVQFCYGGAIGVLKRSIPKERLSRSQFEVVNPATPIVTWEEDDLKRWPLSILAGEPVGVLAATAISQPAYELMLDAPCLNGPFKPRPLELVQETLYPRAKSVLKPIDRTAIIRLVNCPCTQPLCLERRVLAVQAHLKKISLKAIAESCAVEFWNMENFEVAGPSGEALRMGSPWLGHIKLSLNLMKQLQVDVELMVERLRQRFSGIIKNPKKHPMGQIFFCVSYNCGISNGLCLHFSPKLPNKMQNQRNDEIYNTALLALLLKIRGTIISGLLDCTVKGDERIESVIIVSEDPSRTTWHRGLTCNQELEEELVLEVVVSPTKSKSKRGDAWASVKQACLPLMHMVDWNRSMPYSIQEIRHALGVEASYQMISQRLGLVLDKTAPHTRSVHVKLVADMMTFSGDANGFNFSGFQDMNKSTGISAPFTEASFQKPIKTLMDAAGRGATDSVESVLASCVWGKEAPLGTGSNFELFWQPSKDQSRLAASRKAEKDVHMIWKDLHEKCISDKVLPPSPPPSLPGLPTLPDGDVDLDDGAGFSPLHASNDAADDTWGSPHRNNGGDGVAWGDSPVVRDDDGGWGAVGKGNDSNEVDGYDQDNSTGASKELSGWSKPASERSGWGSMSDKEGSSRNAWDDFGKEDRHEGWGDGATEPINEGGWGSLNNEEGTTSGAKCSSDWGTNAVQEIGDGGWDAVSIEVPEGDGWDSLKVPQTENAEVGSSEHADRSYGPGADGVSQEGQFRARGEESRRGGRPWTSRDRRRWRGRGSFGKDRGSSGRMSPGNRQNSGTISRQEQTPWVQGSTKADAWAKHAWASFGSSQGEVQAGGDGWDAVLPDNCGASNRAHSTYPIAGSMPPTSRQDEVEPECKDIDDLVKSMRRILFNPRNELGGRLSDEDDELVQTVLAYHPKLSEKAGCGTAYIKVDRSAGFVNNRCFWLVRTDGSEIDFSFHKCLKEKVAREFPSFLDRYDDVYQAHKRPFPTANFEENKSAAQGNIDAGPSAAHLLEDMPIDHEDLDARPAAAHLPEGIPIDQEDLDAQPAVAHLSEDTPIDQENLDAQPAANSISVDTHFDQQEDIDTQTGQESAPSIGVSSATKLICKKLTEPVHEHQDTSGPH